ncbi:MAG: hypothetical protein RLZ25_128 [Pseudomonadota bacterium]|jgi:hypothetical protein
MNGKARDSKPDWVDSDDAPELTEGFFDYAEWRVGERSVSPLIGIAEMDKEAFIGESQAIGGSPFRR